MPLPFISGGNTLDVRSVLDVAIKANKADLVLKNRDVVRLTTLDVRSKQKIAVFLFRRSDPDAATPIFEHIKTRKLRKSDKRVEEANALSAHMFLRLGEIPDAVYPTYHAILEEVPGLSRTYIQLLLADVVKQVVYQYKDKHGRPKDTHTLVEFQGHKSEKISGALKGQSIVPSVTLIRPANIKGLDVGNLVVPREESMKLLIKAAPDQTAGVIKKIQSWMKGHHWPKLVVQMQLPEGRTRLVHLAREQDATDILFLRSVPVDVKSTLEAATDTINEDLVEKAQDLFAADGV